MVQSCLAWWTSTGEGKGHGLVANAKGLCERPPTKANIEVNGT